MLDTIGIIAANDADPSRHALDNATPGFSSTSDSEPLANVAPLGMRGPSSRPLPPLRGVFDHVNGFEVVPLTLSVAIDDRFGVHRAVAHRRGPISTRLSTRASTWPRAPSPSGTPAVHTPEGVNSASGDASYLSVGLRQTAPFRPNVYPKGLDPEGSCRARSLAGFPRLFTSRHQGPSTARRLLQSRQSTSTTIKPPKPLSDPAGSTHPRMRVQRLPVTRSE